jgi:hypothetical protein
MEEKHLDNDNIIFNLYHPTEDLREKIVKLDFLKSILKNFRSLIPNQDNLGYMAIDNIKVDVNHYYKNNKYGYRSPEFKNAKIVFGGCSNTYGIGVPQEKIWGTQVANALNLSYANLGIPGAGVQEIIQKLFSYFEKYGHPDTVVCLFADFTRMLVPINKNNFLFERYTPKKKNYLNIVQIFLQNQLYQDKKPKYSKLPHNAEDVIPVEFPFYLSFQFINILEYFCKVNNIKLIWSTYDVPSKELIEAAKLEFNDVFNNYVPLYINKIYDKLLLNQTCHQDIKQQYSHCFDKGTDFEHGKPRHLGVHAHVHIAEQFLEYLKEL